LLDVPFGLAGGCGLSSLSTAFKADGVISCRAATPPLKHKVGVVLRDLATDCAAKAVFALGRVINPVSYAEEVGTLLHVRFSRLVWEKLKPN
jgi:hypothetical protein